MLEQLDTLIAFAMVMLLLSLLITTLVQTAITWSRLRGRTLVWGVKEVVEQLGINESHAELLAKGILKHPSISPSKRLCAHAIRVEELARLLPRVMDEIAAPTDPADAQRWNRLKILAANAVEGFLGTSTGQPAAGAQDAIATTKIAADQITDQVVTVLNATGNQALIQATQNLREQIQTSVSVTLADGRRQAAEITAWFNIVMDRTTETFVAYTRAITVFLSFVFCLLLQVDSLEIMQQLSTDEQLRATLVAQVEPMLKQADSVVGKAAAGKQFATEAIKSVHAKLKSDPKTASDAALIASVREDLDSEKDGKEWLIETVTDKKKQERIIDQYTLEYQSLVKKRLSELWRTRDELVGQIEKTQLQLIDAKSSFSRYWKEPRHLFGTLMSALLLSLGAPFWFNTLRNLSNLRPIVARRVEAEKKAAAA